jgi:hypothetical protein
MKTRGLNSACSRRQFLSGCACCAGCAVAGPLLGSRPVFAASSSTGKPKVRLVFCETTNDKPIWPNIGYNFDARRKRLLDALTQGCPDVEFLPVQVMDDPKHADEVLARCKEVDGYMICVQGLGWRNDIFKLSGTGKPTLVVDNLFGGSGLFLTQLPRIMASGKPVDWVSSSRDEDVVASARQFALLRQGKSAAEVAAAFRAARRARTPAAPTTACENDPVALVPFEEAQRKLQKTKILVVGGGWGGDAFRKAAEALAGVKMVAIDFKELAAAYDRADRQAAKAFADRWMQQAEKVVEPDRATIEDSGAMYVAMKELLDKHGAQGISINCLGGFYGGHLKAYPCLGFCQLNDDGLVGGCEADQLSAFTMAVMGAFTGRPGFISDPVIDTSKRQIIYAHCVGPTRVFGPQGPRNPYRIRTHSEDRKGAAIQSILPENRMTTTLEIDPVARHVLFHQARSAGNNPSDMACRTKLEAVVHGDLEKLTETWRPGWHRVTVYGELRGLVDEICQRWKLKLIDEA